MTLRLKYSYLRKAALKLDPALKAMSTAADESVFDNWGLTTDRNRNPLTSNARRYWSQSDEDGILEKILARLETIGRGTFIEFGVGDGTECNTLALLAKGWSGAWVSGQDLVFEPAEDGRLHFHKTWITLENIESITKTVLQDLDVVNPDIVSLDLDGNDFHFTRSLLQNGLRASVWISEYNGRFPADAKWVMDYNPSHEWTGDDYYGASFASFCELFEEFGYFPVACSVTGVNTFFVHKSFEGFFADITQNRDEIYQLPNYNLPGSWGHPVSPKTLASLTQPISSS